MVEMEARYDGHKKCSLRHQEGSVLQTDAPQRHWRRGVGIQPD